MKTCTHCNKENRDRAVYCRFCGTAMPVAAKPPSVEASRTDSLDDMIGLETAKELVRRHAAVVMAIVRKRGKQAMNRINSNILITGPSGTGKTAFTLSVATYLKEQGLFKDEEEDVFSSLSIDSLDLAENPLKAVVVDDAHKLLPDDPGADLTGTALEYLFENSRIRLMDGDDRLMLIINGSQELQDYIDRRPELKALFALNIRLPEYTPTEVAGICENIIREKHGLTLDRDAFDKLCRVFNRERRNAVTFGNAHLAAAKANELVMAAEQRTRGAATAVTADDVTGDEFVPKTLEQVMADFDKYVGVDEIKQTITGIANSVRSFRKLHPDKDFVLTDHYIFVGNPGTGKTTMARLFADALSAMAVLPSGQLVEASPGDMKGQYMGQTAPRVDALFDRAMGGVLFIDEAYGIHSGEGDSFGNEAVTALIKNVEDRRGKLVVILAGYETEMEQFATANPGIPSRFGVTIRFRDYKGPELAEIARRMIKAKGYTIAPESEKAIEKFFEKMYVARKKDFANARDVRNAVDKAIRAQNVRIQGEMTLPGFDSATEFVVTNADFTGEGANPPKSVDEVIASLDDLIGMADIKQEIRKLANVAMVNRMRMERGLGAAALQPVNIILTGNPGTGKTTIAKRLGQVLHAAGVLSTPRVVEREAKTILSSYVNQSGINMDKAVDEAMGGVLFIDEAYNLLPQPGSTNNTGNEALDALMTRMENDKGKFVVVIAGYRDRMEELTRRGNPGLMSRFNKRFHIDDYDADALLEIFRLNVGKRKFALTPEADAAVARHIRAMTDNKGLHFGNAREVVNLLNEVIENQGCRIAADSSIIDTNPDALTTIEATDIPQFT